LIALLDLKGNATLTNVLLDFIGNATLTNVVWAELVACFLSLSIALISMRRHLADLRGHAGDLGWSPPRMFSLWQTAFSMHVAHLLTLASSPQVFVNLIQRLLGVEAAALFGFLRNLTSQIAGYLPSNLFFSLIRPKLVASYVGGGGMAEINRNANLAGKLSLFVLMPLVALVALAGDPIVALVSSSKFMGSAWLLLGFILTLVPFSQRLLLESVAVAIGKAGLCTWAAASGLITLPIFWFLLDSGLVHLLFNFVLVAGLSKFAGFRTDRVGFLKMSVSALAAYGASMWLPLDGAANILGSPWAPVMLQCTFVVLFYFSVAWLIKPFTSGERDQINVFAKRRVFIW
jgi:O-antigen/teichoic acid export membrane protein